MRFQCPSCKDIVTAADGQFGKKMTCQHCNCPVVTPESAFGAGMVIGDFIIIKQLGSGGAGVVFLAHQISLDRPAALKIIKESSKDIGENPVQDLIREARSAAKLNHPNIVQAYAVGEDDGVFYFAMEFVDGETMKSVLKREGTIEPRKAAGIIKQIADGLQFAWDKQKLTHRDIKPDNIMYTSTKQAKLADLGLSRQAGEHEEDADSDEVMGTPQYISPEQLTGAEIDTRSDIYSLGATFYQFVTGRFPYEGPDIDEIAKQHVIGNLIPPRDKNYNVPEEINNIIMKMMARYPENRYQSPGEVSKAIDAYLHPGSGAAAATPGSRLRSAAMSAQAPAGETLGGGLRAGGMKVLEAPSKGGTSLKSAFHRPEHTEQEPLHTIGKNVPTNFDEAMASLPTQSKKLKLNKVEAAPEGSKGATAAPVVQKKSSGGVAALVVILLVAALAGGFLVLKNSGKTTSKSKTSAPQVVQTEVETEETPSEPVVSESLTVADVFDAPAPVDGDITEALTNMNINFALTVRNAAAADDAAMFAAIAAAVDKAEEQIDGKNATEKRLFKSMYGDCRDVLKVMAAGLKVKNAITNGDELNGMQFEANGKSYEVTGAANGVLNVTENGGEATTFDPAQLRGTALENFFKNVGKKLSVTDAYYAFMFYNGFYPLIARSNCDMLTRQQANMFEKNYFRGVAKYGTEEEMAKVSGLYGANYGSLAEAVAWARKN